MNIKDSEMADGIMQRYRLLVECVHPIRGDMTNALHSHIEYILESHQLHEFCLGHYFTTVPSQEKGVRYLEAKLWLTRACLYDIQTKLSDASINKISG